MFASPPQYHRSRARDHSLAILAHRSDLAREKGLAHHGKPLVARLERLLGGRGGSKRLPDSSPGGSGVGQSVGLAGTPWFGHGSIKGTR